MGIEQIWITCSSCKRSLFRVDRDDIQDVFNLECVCRDCGTTTMIKLQKSPTTEEIRAVKAEVQDNYVPHDSHDPVREAIDAPAEPHKAGDPPRPMRPLQDLPKKPWKSMAMAEAERICGPEDDE